MKLFNIIIVLLLLFSCSNDHGLAPLRGRLGVNVIFLQDRPPENTEGVYLFVAPKFPPHAINELYLSPNSLPLEQDTVYTEMALPFGRYEAVGLWWYNKETNSNLADVVTLKLDEKLQPYAFDVNEQESNHEIELWANLNRVDRDATIEGTIHFNGPIPKHTLVIGVAAYLKRPVDKVEYLVYLMSMDFSVDNNPYHYQLPVKSKAGSVKYLVVLWLPERAGLDSFQELGFYHDPENPGEPGSIRLQPNTVVSGYDIYADWNQVQ